MPLLDGSQEPAPLCSAAELARRLGVSRPQITAYVREGLPADARKPTKRGGERLLYDESRARRWIAENISHTVGGERAGAGRPPDVPGVDRADPVDEIMDAKGDLTALQLDGIDVTSAEKILEQLAKLSPRQAATLLSTLKAARERHELDVARKLYVKADECAAEWMGMITQAKDRLDDAVRAACDEISAALNLTTEQRTRVQEIVGARVREAQSVLAGES